MFRTSRLWERIFLLAAAILLIKPGLETDIIGAALLAVVVIVQLASRRAAVAAALQPPLK